MEEVVGRGGRRRRTRTEGRQETGERSIVESDGYGEEGVSAHCAVVSRGAKGGVWETG